jgi:hypothetical protein
MEACDIHPAPPPFVAIFTLSVFALHALRINEKRPEKTAPEDRFDIDRSFDLSVLAFLRGM